MKTKIVSLLLAVGAFLPATSFALSCGEVDPVTGSVFNCGNGSPETVVNEWGTTNSQLPHILPGQTRIGADGSLLMCPAWFPVHMYCVDITGTDYYKSRWGR